LKIFFICIDKCSAESSFCQDENRGLLKQRGAGFPYFFAADLRGFSRIGKSNVKRFSHRARGAHRERRVGKSKSKAYSQPESAGKGGLESQRVFWPRIFED